MCNYNSKKNIHKFRGIEKKRSGTNQIKWCWRFVHFIQYLKPRLHQSGNTLLFRQCKSYDCVPFDTIHAHEFWQLRFFTWKNDKWLICWRLCCSRHLKWFFPSHSIISDRIFVPNNHNRAILFLELCDSVTKEKMKQK